MKTRILHSTLRPISTPGADGTDIFDLPVNPLSMILLRLRPLNDTGTLANFPDYLEICDALDAVRILYRGASVINARGKDLAAYNYFRHGLVPADNHAAGNNVNNDRREVILPIYLGRMPFDSRSCFPSTKRGEFTMELQYDIASTGYDTFSYGVETIEILGAEPKEYERKSVISKTFAATGDQDFELPTGYDYRGLFLFGTTGHDGASPAPSWGSTGLKLMREGQECWLTGGSWQGVRVLGQLMGRLPPPGKHKHIVTTDGNVQAELATLAGPYDESVGWENYGFLDLDPTRDDEFSVETNGVSSFNIRANVGTADAVRVLPIERIPL